MECTTESGDSVSSGSGDRYAEQEQAEGTESGGYCFSKKLITFTLYGKIHPKSKRPWNETLSAKIANVQELFKNIPPMLYFSPSSVSIDGIGVYSAEPLPKATSLGPYFGKAVHKNQVEGDKHNEWLWEVYQDASLVYYVDASDPKYGNWMNFIQCARSKQEQNLKALQHDDYLYFEATRDIVAGEELLVWYDEFQYNMYMGIPIGYKKRTVDGRTHNIRKSCFGSTTLTKTQPTNEEEFLNETSGIHSTPITGHTVSDTSSASTDDSGISLHFEPTTTGAENLTKSTERSVSPMDQKLAEHSSLQESMEVTTTHTYPTSPSDCFQCKTMQALTENVYQSATSTDQPLDKPSELECMVEKSQPAFQDVMQWQPPTNGSTNTSITTSPKQPSPLAPPSPAQQPSVKSTLGGGKQKPSNLLYGMFSRSVDGTRWQCEECKKLFSSQGSLRAHARIHTGERPYQCQYCYRTFCQASTLRSHERLHTGEKPYKCEYCGRAFTQSAGLRSHLKTHRYDS